jgi:class 3 adenylate cyclase
VPAERRIIEVLEPGRLPIWIAIGDRLPIGRAGDGLLLTDQRLSRHHCEFWLDADTLAVVDNASSNGTFVNGVRIVTATTLLAGDEVVIGDTHILVDPDRVALDSAESGLEETVLGSLPHDDLKRSVAGGTITIVFSDIVDSTALNGVVGDQMWFALLQRHNDLVRESARRHEGTEVRTQGDGFLLTFPSARKAVQFAIAVQSDLAELRTRDPEFMIRIRIGIHTGEVIRDAGEIFGIHVNQAARVAAEGSGDEVVASRLVYELVSPMGGFQFGERRTVELKGFEGEHAIYPVLWR